MMTNSNENLIRLEETLAYLENTIDTLNQVVTEQTGQISDLQRQMQLMYNYLHNNSDDGIAPFDLMADKPPHY